MESPYIFDTMDYFSDALKIIEMENTETQLIDVSEEVEEKKEEDIVDVIETKQEEVVEKKEEVVEEKKRGRRRQIKSEEEKKITKEVQEVAKDLRLKQQEQRKKKLEEKESTKQVRKKIKVDNQVADIDVYNTKLLNVNLSCFLKNFYDKFKMPYYRKSDEDLEEFASIIQMLSDVKKIDKLKEKSKPVKKKEEHELMLPTKRIGDIHDGNVIGGGTKKRPLVDEDEKIFE